MVTVIDAVFVPGGGRGSRRDRVKIKCDCGNVTESWLKEIKNGTKKSCGCLSNKLFRERTTKHGLSTHPLNGIYRTMKSRCYNSNTREFERYGARGIKMCEEWKNDFYAFYKWAMENGWQKGLQFDRFPDNDGDYSPFNCRITTNKKNSINKRDTFKATYNGLTMPIPDWIEHFGSSISYKLVYSRLTKNKWNIYDAITKPSLKKLTNEKK